MHKVTDGCWLCPPAEAEAFIQRALDRAHQRPSGSFFVVALLISASRQQAGLSKYFAEASESGFGIGGWRSDSLIIPVGPSDVEAARALRFPRIRLFCKGGLEADTLLDMRVDSSAFGFNQRVSSLLRSLTEKKA